MKPVPVEIIPLTLDWTVISIVIGYLGIMLFIGYYSSKKITKSDDFMVAGRRLGPLMMAGTLAATEIGGGSSLGVVEKAFGDWGMSAIWYVLTMTVTFFVLSIFAPNIRNAMVKTVPEYFRRRYGKPSGLLTAIIMLLPLIGLTAIQFIASSVILSVMTGWSYVASLIVVVIVVTFYSVLGGLWSVTLTDVVQMFLIVFGLIIAVPYALQAGGGWDKIMSAVPVEKMSLTKGIGWKSIISLTIMYIASFAVGQEAVQRYYAAKDGKAARRGSIYAGLIYLLFAFVPAILGIIAYSMTQTGIIEKGVIIARGTRYVLPILAVKVMPSWLVGIVFAALISATMSSADSDLLAAGSIFSNDIYAKYIRKDADDKEILNVTRIGMILIALMAMGVAYNQKSDIITILMFSFTLRAGGSFFPYIMGHYWKKGSQTGAIASIISGSAVVLLVKYKIVSFFSLDPILPGLLISLITFVLFSLVKPGTTTELKGSS